MQRLLSSRSIVGFVMACLLASIPYAIQAQEEIPVKRVYLLANLDKLAPTDPFFDEASQMIQSDPYEPSVLLLGDLYRPEASEEDLSPTEERHINRVVKALRPSKGSLHIFGGDRDWNNSGQQGDKHIRKLEKFIEKKLGLRRAFIPSKSCPGPQVIELSDELALIAVNSQWFMHPYDRPEAPQTNCKILSEADFWEELEEAIESVEGRNVIIAAHHPIHSNGPYAGKKMAKWHLLPVFGTFLISHRQHIGRPSDLSNEAYTAFRFRMQALLRNYHSIIYASGHEYNTEVLLEGDNYFVNSGAIVRQTAVGKSDDTRFRTAQKSFVRIDYFPDGRVQLFPLLLKNKNLAVGEKIPLFAAACAKETATDIPRNRNFPVCKKQSTLQNTLSVPEVTPDSVVAGPEYSLRPFRQWSMGPHYRMEWTAPIQTEFLDIQTKFGGLVPYAKGGGLQTHSLKFKAANGRVYAFRSVDKDPIKALDAVSKQTIYRHIVKDLITTQHPYGGLVASKLLDQTDILHPRPELFLMPDDPSLDVYRADFRYKLGTLEIRPRKAEKGREGFEGADDVDSSNKMFRAFYKDHDNRIDAHNYARARIFDMLVGDWDRHEDNWKWAAFEDGKKTVYKAIPRDRDHVFSQWEGLIPSIADKVVPNAEHFDYQFKNVNHLNWKARHLDRQLATELSEEDWLTAARYIQAKMTDAVIDSAILEIPKGVRHFHGDEIAQKLKSRRADLLRAVSELYKLLATEVDVVGSNKREIFVIDRQADGKVLVKMYDRKKGEGGKGELLYQRLFKPEETNEIRLFGLGKDDEFYLTGESEKSILVRIISGKGKDLIDDQSKVKKGKQTLVYDSRFKDQVSYGKSTKILRPDKEAAYDNKAFDFSYFSPFPKFRISSGNGFGFELLLTYFKREFNKPDFGWKHQAKLIYYPGLRAHRADLRSWRRHAIGKTDLLFHLRFSSLYDKFPFFYGLGNDSQRDLDLAESDFYRTDFDLAHFTTALEHTFLKQSLLRLGIQYEFNNIQPLKDKRSIFNESPFNRLKGMGEQHLFGLIQTLNLDFRDNPAFSKRGSQFYLAHRSFIKFGETNEFFGRIDGHIAHYMTARIGIPITLALRVGGSHTYGEVPFYYLSPLGSNANLRTYVRNRFLGDKAAFANSELRFHIGTLRTPLVPIKWGLLGFADSGRVWFGDVDENSEWHAGFGGGIFAAPLSDNFNIFFVAGKNRADEFYFSVSTSFDLQ